jgi:hypothetical protein
VSDYFAIGRPEGYAVNGVAELVTEVRDRRTRYAVRVAARMVADAEVARHPWRSRITRAAALVAVYVPMWTVAAFFFAEAIR